MAKSAKSPKSTASRKRSPTTPAVRRVRAPDPEPDREAIAALAYELFLRRGGTHGHDYADWLAAERELAPSRAHDGTA